jgi:hypothetical protein
LSRSITKASAWTFLRTSNASNTFCADARFYVGIGTNTIQPTPNRSSTIPNAGE